MREKLNQIYVDHLTKPHTLEEIGTWPLPLLAFFCLRSVSTRKITRTRPLYAS